MKNTSTDTQEVEARGMEERIGIEEAGGQATGTALADPPEAEEETFRVGRSKLRQHLLGYNSRFAERLLLHALEDVMAVNEAAEELVRLEPEVRATVAALSARTRAMVGIIVRLASVGCVMSDVDYGDKILNALADDEQTVDAACRDFEGDPELRIMAQVKTLVARLVDAHELDAEKGPEAPRTPADAETPAPEPESESGPITAEGEGESSELTEKVILSRADPGLRPILRFLFSCDYRCRLAAVLVDRLSTHEHMFKRMKMYEGYIGSDLDSLWQEEVLNTPAVVSSRPAGDDPLVAIAAGFCQPLIVLES